MQRHGTRANEYDDVGCEREGRCVRDATNKKLDSLLLTQCRCSIDGRQTDTTKIVVDSLSLSLARLLAVLDRSLKRVINTFRSIESSNCISEKNLV